MITREVTNGLKNLLTLIRDSDPNQTFTAEELGDHLGFYATKIETYQEMGIIETGLRLTLSTEEVVEIEVLPEM